MKTSPPRLSGFRFDAIRTLGLVLALTLSPRVMAAETADRESFRGIKTVFVMVEGIPEFTDLDSRLQTAVELRLRKAGVTVLEQGGAEKVTYVPFLYVNVNVLANTDRETGVNAVSVRVGFCQLVFLPAFPIKQSVLQATPTRASVRGDPFVAETWHSGSVGRYAAAVIEKKILEAVEDHTDRFLNDYLAVNPPAKPLKD